MRVGRRRTEPRNEAGVTRNVSAGRERVRFVERIEADLAGERGVEVGEKAALVG